MGVAPASRSGKLWWWLLGLVVVGATGTALFLSAAVIKKPAGDIAGSGILPALTLNGSRLTLEGASPSTVDLEPIVRQLAQQQISQNQAADPSINGLVSVASGGGLVRVGSGTVLDPYRLGLQACPAGKILTSQGGGTWGCATPTGTGGGVSYSAGSGILISGSQISNTGVLSLRAGNGLSASGGQNPTMSFAAGAASGQIWQWNGSQWVLAALPPSGVSGVGALDGQPKNANGAAIAGSTLYLQSADGSFPGLITTAAQTLAGNKTLTGALTVTNAALFQNAANSATAFAVKDAAGYSLMNLDTANGKVTFQNTLDSGSAFVVMDSGGSVMMVIDTVNNLTSFNGRVSVNVGYAGASLLVGNAAGNTGVTTFQLNALTNQTGNLFSALSSGSVVVTGISPTGAALFQNSVNSTGALMVKNAAGSNLLTIDSLNSRLGLNLGGSNLPSVTFDMVGALRLAGGVSDTTSFLTPGAASTPTKINIPLYDPGYSGQVLAFGVPSTAGVTSRALTLFDARTVAHQPTLAVLNPAESDGVGFSWDGSNTVAGIKTIGTADITVNDALKVFKTAGNVSVGSVGLSTAYTMAVSSPNTTLGGVWIRLQGNPEKFFKVDTTSRPTSDVFNIGAGGNVWMSPLTDAATTPALRIRDSSGNYTALDVDTQYGALAINQNVSTTGAAALDVINGYGSTTQITFRATAVASQTADVFQIVNSGGAVVVSISPAGDLTVKNGIVNGDLTVKNKIVTNGATPTIAAGAAAGTGATVSVTGNDISGVITITTGTSPTSGTLATLTFALPYATAPRVTLSANNASAAQLTNYVASTTTNFTLSTPATPVASTTYTFYYHVIQ